MYPPLCSSNVDDNRTVCTYPYALINFSLSLGLILLKIPRFSTKFKYNWAPPFEAWWVAVGVFAGSNLFLVVAPFVPPEEGKGPYEGLVYWVRFCDLRVRSFLFSWS